MAWSSTAWLPDQFYSDWNCRQFFKNHVTAVVTRQNTFNGLAYRDDPAIMGWELMNEPRDQLDPDGSTMLEWIKEMVRYTVVLGAHPPCSSCASEPISTCVRLRCRVLNGGLQAAHVKSLDSKHLLTVGLEGFYGPNAPNKWTNPGAWATKMGSDFLTHHQVSNLTMACVQELLRVGCPARCVGEAAV